MKKVKVSFDVDQLEFAVQVTRALAHPLRMKILECIDELGTVNVNKIYNTLGLEKSIAAQHLQILRYASVVFAEREGKLVFYTINYALIEKVVNAVSNFLGKSVDSLDPMDEYYYETLEALIEQGKYEEFESFGNDLISKSKDVDPEINEIVNDSFWDLI